MCICSNFSRRGLPRKFSLILTFFCFLAISIASRLPRSLLWSLLPGSSWKIVCFAPSSHGREPELQQRMQMPFSRLAESALFCANFAVASAGLICLACTILLAVTVWKLTAFSADFGGRCGIYGVCDTEPAEGERLVRQLWHYTPFTVEKTSKTGPACSV